MMITTDGIVAFCAGFLTVAAVAGLLVKFVLLPYLRTNLVTPVAEVHEQVKNTHDTNLREDIDALQRTVTKAARQSERQWSQHLAYSESIAHRLNVVERRLENLGQRPDDT